MFSMSAMRNSKIGRSPEMLRPHSPGCRRLHVGSYRTTHASSGRHRAGARRDAGTAQLLARIDAEVMELDPRPRPGERGGPLEGGGIAVLVDDVEQRLARGSSHSPERNMNDRAGRNPHTAAQGKDWIEHNADRVRERPTSRSSRSAFGYHCRVRGNGPCRSRSPAYRRFHRERRRDVQPRFRSLSVHAARRVARMAPTSARYRSLRTTWKTPGV